MAQHIGMVGFSNNYQIKVINNQELVWISVIKYYHRWKQHHWQCCTNKKQKSRISVSYSLQHRIIYPEFIYLFKITLRQLPRAWGFLRKDKNALNSKVDYPITTIVNKLTANETATRVRAHLATDNCQSSSTL